jgi:pilus assembly protein CpaB
MRAMSVRVDQVNGVAGFVFPEARVDVLVTGLPTDSPEQGQITRTILGNVRVLSAGEHLTPDATGKPQKVAVVTLLVEPQQAELVTLAQSRGQIQLVLRNSNDEQVPLTSGIREREVFGTGLAPVTNVERPALPRPIVQVALPPPSPPVEIEVIRGADRSIQTFPELTGN